MLGKIQSKLGVTFVHNPNPHALYVGEQQYGETIPTADNYIIGSHAFTSCILIGLYHPYRSAMPHLNVYTNYDELLPSLWKEYTRNLNNTELIKVFLMGGTQPDSLKFAEAIRHFFKNKKCQVNEELLYTDYNVLAINSKNGNIIASNGTVEPDRTTQRLVNQLTQLEDTISEDVAGNFVTKVISDGEFLKNLTVKNILIQDQEGKELDTNSSNTNGYASVFQKNHELCPQNIDNSSSNLKEGLERLDKSFQ